MKKINPFYLIIVFYFVLRTFNLGILPIFNDEAIYIDWGQKMLNSNNFFFSLFDGKQPFLMWVFGFFANIFSNPLIGGRSVSVIFGFISLITIYKISTRLFDRKIGYVSSLIYCLSPLFLFFDRQALMESAISAIGLIAFYLIFEFLETKKYLIAFELGLVFGLGLFIKSTSIVFLISFFLISIIFKKVNLKEYKKYLLILISTLFFLLPLFIQKDFLNIFTMNSRYAFSFSEIIKFPLNSWISNLISIIDISFFQAFFLSIVFIPFSFFNLKKETNIKLLFFWSLLPIIIYLVSSRTPNPRYLVSFLPIFSILIAKKIDDSKKRLLVPLLTISFLYFSFFDFLLLTKPAAFFNILSSFSNYSQEDVYLKGFTSGYGVQEAVNFIKNQTNENNALVGVRLDAGNPENSTFIYFSKSKNIKVSYLDSRIINLPAKQNFFYSDFPIYFVSRDNQLAGLDKYMELEEKFFKPDYKSFIGVYKVRTKERL